MPNQPRPDNPGRVIRFENALWEQVRAAARAAGVNPSEIVRRAVRAFVNPPTGGNQ